ncbi:adenine phosphoribosyltransferase [Amorphoplanes digitatis]|uniref:Adenine phosphoribosyltransferase n=1 Tax=Actinoplanes digitatis TaxID=1868 RepID=A0A7W7MQY6_9ACTN|nr:adenine phosphoribosyltransferase [Actinoplanes digitatis]MBB4763055.1 adenine phosphoribosyltransferase [Actinoplanes digitatis]
MNIDLKSAVRVYPDFPTPGIAFQDLAPLYGTPGLLGRLGEALARSFPQGYEVVLAVEARGFVIGTAVAMAAGRPLVLARKQGKLPGPLHRTEYALEYGSAVLTIQHAAVPPGAKVLVVDDVLATGGTLAAAARLVEEAGAAVSGFGVVLDIEALGARARLAPVPVVSLLTAS